MTGEQIFGIIIMVMCSWGCGAVFYGIGVWANRRKDPMHFYSGTQVDPRTVSDIPAYNRANGKMWKRFSVPFWLAGIAAFFSSGISAVLLGLACFPGLLLLILNYQRICKEFIIR